MKLAHAALGPRSPFRDGLNPNHPDYARTGRDMVDYLIAHAGLRPDSSILDIGCGTGRMANALAGYLDGGEYLGVDINRHYIDACRNKFRFRKGFRFRHVDHRHPEWNPGGAKVPFRLDVPVGSVDLVLLFGVLYHLDFDSAAEAIQQASPALRSYGSMAATVRLLNHHSMAHLSGRYRHRSDKSWYADRDRPLLDVAHPEEGFRRFLIHSRLQIREPVRYGLWASAGGPLDADLLVAVKV